MRVHRHKHSIRIRAQMHQSDACAGPAHPTEQAQPLNPPPRPPQPNVDLLSPTCACVLPAETMMRFLRAGGQIEWLSIMTVMHGLRAARQSMLSARARLPRLILGAAAPACASRHAQAAMITTCARPRFHHRRQRLARTGSRLVCVRRTVRRDGDDAARTRPRTASGLRRRK